MSISELFGTLAILERRGVITTDTSKRDTCCGIERDEDGFCIYRPGHPAYVEAPAWPRNEDHGDE